MYKAMNILLSMLLILAISYVGIRNHRSHKLAAAKLRAT
jgi:hypothetical protein